MLPPHLSTYLHLCSHRRLLSCCYGSTSLALGQPLHTSTGFQLPSPAQRSHSRRVTTSFHSIKFPLSLDYFRHHADMLLLPLPTVPPATALFLYSSQQNSSEELCIPRSSSSSLATRFCPRSPAIPWKLLFEVTKDPATHKPVLFSLSSF